MKPYKFTGKCHDCGEKLTPMMPWPNLFAHLCKALEEKDRLHVVMDLIL